MKIITIKVFTSLSEVRTWWKELKSKNISIIGNFYLTWKKKFAMK